jgi:glucan biosynthesis protein C
MATPQTSPAATQSDRAARSYEIDWLRVLLTLLIFLYHSSRPYNLMENWHFKDRVLSMGFDVPQVVFGIWAMASFFLVSGISSYYSVQARGPREFLRSRFLRLAVPLIGLGWFVLSPPQVYIERVAGTQYHTVPFSGTFWQFIPEYFRGIYGRGGSFALTGMHLWYLFWLFVLSVVALPLFMWLNGHAGRRLVNHLAECVQRRGLILLPGLALCVFEVLKPTGFPWGVREGGWYILSYLLLLIFSYIWAMDQRFGLATDRDKRLALALAVVTDLLVGAHVVGQLLPEFPQILAGGPDWAWEVVRVFCAWCSMMAILGYARKYLRAPRPILAYASQAVLPFYMLHQTVIVIIAFLIRGWALAVGLKYLFVVVTTFVLVMGLYEFAIRRNRVLRFLFGMPPDGSR